MNLKSEAAALRFLLAALVLGLASCDTPSNDNESLSSSSREPRKYLEVDDLNAFESPATRLVASHGGDSEEAVFGHLSKSGWPKKVVRREALVPKNNATAQGRTARQSPKKQRPGFLWTIARVTYETFNDTRSAIKQIGQIINESIAPDPPKKKASLKKPITSAKAAGGKKPSNADVVATTQPTTTTTEEFKLTRPLLQSLVRRNVLGLVRLFNIEWRDAISESKNSVREFRSDLGKQIGMFLQDNPNNY
ncbi:uncharacterized protein LOC106638073 [Copidosoma floridanum]|uniref:uncharacterized protein LOC106638073 n=1 Tax=Copidosoma floridanum TaxID=29053 RepID=UPI0006C95B89|nr:uncharacterized protein LOC106638073 [Copidosoma floridanum]XP_014206595.1 uncharacterized protein LOC106638073 [Copidosoma floridanum]XP_014206603.1 uncharacterized protein LOC106638073 [Copidosoma floridanum]